MSEPSQFRSTSGPDNEQFNNNEKTSPKVTEEPRSPYKYKKNIVQLPQNSPRSNNSGHSSSKSNPVSKTSNGPVQRSHNQYEKTDNIQTYPINKPTHSYLMFILDEV